MIKGHAPLGFDFRKWFEKKREELLKPARIIIFEKGSQHMPLLIIFGYNDETLPIGMAGEFGDNYSKDVATNLQRMLAAKVETVAAAIFFSEVWTLRDPVKPEEMPDSIHDHPDRIEAYMMNAMHGNEQVLVVYPIDRKNKKFGEPKILDNMAKGFRMEGRMTVEPPTRQ